MGEKEIVGKKRCIRETFKESKLRSGANWGLKQTGVWSKLGSGANWGLEQTGSGANWGLERAEVEFKDR